MTRHFNESNVLVPTKKAASENVDDPTFQHNSNSVGNSDIFPWEIITARQNGDSDLCNSA